MAFRDSEGSVLCTARVWEWGVSQQTEDLELWGLLTNFSSMKSFTMLDRVYQCRVWEGSIDVWGRKFIPLVGSYFQLGTEVFGSLYIPSMIAVKKISTMGP